MGEILLPNTLYVFLHLFQYECINQRWCWFKLAWSYKMYSNGMLSALAKKTKSVIFLGIWEFLWNKCNLLIGLLVIYIWVVLIPLYICWSSTKFDSTLVVCMTCTLLGRYMFPSNDIHSSSTLISIFFKGIHFSWNKFCSTRIKFSSLKKKKSFLNRPKFSISSSNYKFGLQRLY